MYLAGQAAIYRRRQTKFHDRLLSPVIKLFPEKITPNHLSGLRIFLATIIILLMYGHYYKISGIIFLVAAIFDAMDGSMARLRDQVTEIGAYLDPLADKIINFTAFLGFLFYIKSDYYLSLIIAILAIDFTLFLIATFKYSAKNIFYLEMIKIKKSGANHWGKIKMVLQVIVLSCLLLFDPERSILLHEKYFFLPNRLTLLHLSYPILIACIFFGAMSLRGHIQAIEFRKKIKKPKTLY